MDLAVIDVVQTSRTGDGHAQGLSALSGHGHLAAGVDDGEAVPVLEVDLHGENDIACVLVPDAFETIGRVCQGRDHSLGGWRTCIGAGADRGPGLLSWGG